MTDLINRVDELIRNDIGSVEKLMNKYVEVLKHTKPERQYPYYAYLIDTCVTIIKKNHENEDADWKTWAVLLVFNLYRDKKIGGLEDIDEIIAEFFEFKKQEYRSYCEDIISVNEYERDKGFMYRFYWRKSNN